MQWNTAALVDVVSESPRMSMYLSVSVSVSVFAIVYLCVWLTFPSHCRQVSQVKALLMPADEYGLLLVALDKAYLTVRCHSQQTSIPISSLCTCNPTHILSSRTYLSVPSD